MLAGINIRIRLLKIRYAAMEVSVLIRDFMQRTTGDARIGPVHLSLYLAILYVFIQQGGQVPISVYSRDMMRLVHISPMTYHKYMRELKEYGYIGYVPSFNPVLGSLVYLLLERK